MTQYHNKLTDILFQHATKAFSMTQRKGTFLVYYVLFIVLFIATRLSVSKVM